jgi:hypothetical protein
MMPDQRSYCQRWALVGSLPTDGAHFALLHPLGKHTLQNERLVQYLCCFDLLAALENRSNRCHYYM